MKEKFNSLSKKKKIAIYVVIALLILALIETIMTDTAEVSYDISSAEITYETEGTPAKDAVYEDAKTFTTGISGDYVIGKSPSEYATGDETEFTTAQSGSYVAGTDFPAGVYDIIATEGNGNVTGTGLNEIMGVGTGLSAIDGMYVGTYDNKVFKDGDELETSGVAVTLTPQTDDKDVIPANKYNLVAVEGSGNVIGTGINEIMGPEGTEDFGLDMYVDRVENKEFKDGDNLSVTGVSIELQPVEDKILVKEATEAIPGEERTEKLESSDKGEVCYIDDKEADCGELGKYDELTSNLEVTGSVTESMSKANDEYTCKIDDKEADCSELIYGDDLKAQLDEQ